ncbi:hypothetical protein NM688_g5018 [Phlebia brevispora]|uniref:Uncharacterized protein n=1 Tax=Phlebia brevispora TaxID=194682 RepID=A0ACC1T194_9APHY|nr:hypothetical protein NM688_g5018 [Phlebia brevispora]
MAEEQAPSRQWVLKAESEYRFELDPGASLAIKLIQGQAEIFGAELADGKTYLFYEECRPSTEYVAEETPMAAYANLHLAFEAMRVRAIQHSDAAVKPPTESDGENTEPPRVLILGPENSGKTTLSKILINYATRSGQGWWTN